MYQRVMSVFHYQPMICWESSCFGQWKENWSVFEGGGWQSI